MKLTLEIDLPAGITREAFVRAAARGLTSTNDAGEAIVVALEVAAGYAVPSPSASTPAAIAHALDACGGNVSKVARQFGIARATVRVRAARAKAARVDVTRAADEWQPDR